MTFLKRFTADTSGATAIEYGLLAALLGVAIIGGANAIGNQTTGIFAVVDNKIN
ncbi:MAG: Flp family type IVb pilin [Robiginitomaculum sp.]